MKIRTKPKGFGMAAAVLLAALLLAASIVPMIGQYRITEITFDRSSPVLFFKEVF